MTLSNKFRYKFGYPQLDQHIRTQQNEHYEFETTEDILELEFTKILEAGVRFRKCKRCGRYFIMKGNYDINYYHVH